MNRLLCLLFIGMLVGCATDELPIPTAEATIPPPDVPSYSSQPLSGRLHVLAQDIYPDFRIEEIVLETGEIRTLYRVPNGAWLTQLTNSPASDEMSLIYTAPQEEGIGITQAGVYQLHHGGDEPVPLLVPDHENEFFYNPMWSDDGAYLYYVRSRVGATSADGFTVHLMRYDAETAEQMEIVADGIWPAIDPQQTQLAYIAVDPVTLERGVMVSDLDGGNVQEVLPIGRFYDVDSLLFSAEGDKIYMAIAQSAPELSWFNQLTGTQIGHAHVNKNVRSAWWEMRLTDGTLTQLTPEDDVILSGWIDDENNGIFYTTLTGIYWLDLATNNRLTITSGEIYRSIVWHR